ncbi:MAG: hypothetical protein KC493_11895 [Bacteriovoracaceae bacterium]|nr:hypothetical protein [Bacteriovoracaceae bacterium]
MKKIGGLLLLSLLISSCGDEVNNYSGSANPVNPIDQSQGDTTNPTGEADLDLSLLSPSNNNIKAKHFITRGKPLTESDKRYTKVDILKNKKLTTFNHTSFATGTREVIISGKHILINKVDLQGIRKLLNNQSDISSVTINAERVDIESELKIPSSIVTINARTLLIRKNGSIDLTPNPFLQKAAQFKNGTNGIHGSSLTLNLERIEIDSNIKSPVFKVKGGNGQEAGNGQAGTKGRNGTHLGGNVIYRVTEKEHCIRERPDRWKFWDCHSRTDKAGSPTWPTSGTAAKPGGKPGLPGNGGSFISNIEVAKNFIDLSGGKSGKAAKAIYKGGAAGTPTTAHHQYIFTSNHNRNQNRMTATHRTSKGSDAKSPGIVRPTGTVGKVSLSKDDSWQNDGYFEFTLKYAKDLYKLNQLDSASMFIEEVLGECEKINSKNDKVFYAPAVCSKSVAQKFQMTSQLDYFGNNATWVPNLSFEANYQLFNTEVERSFRILYLTYWLLNTHQSLEDKIAAIMKTQDQHHDQIEEDSKNFNSLTDKIPGIKKKLEDVKVDETQFREELARVEAQIIAEAQRNVSRRHKIPFYKKAVKVLAAISTVIPAGQPALAAIGNTVNAVVQGIGTDKPWQQVIDTLPNTIGSFMPSKLEESRRNWNEVRQKIDYSNYRRIYSMTPANSGLTPKQIKQQKSKYLKDLSGFMKPIAKELAKMAKQSQQSQVPQGEVNSEIQRIKNSHPLFKRITQKLEALLAKRKELAGEIAHLTTLLGHISNGIVESYVSIAKLGEAQAHLEGGVDASLKAVLKEIEDKTKDRLDKYNYLLVKAYQYRMLKEFPGQLDLVPVLKKIDNLVKSSRDGVLSPSEFNTIKGMYENQMSLVIESVVDEFNSGRSLHNQATRSFNLSKSQIRALNEGYTIYLDLKNRNVFGSSNPDLSLEDIRINNIKVVNMDFEVDGNPEVIAEGTLLLRYSGSSYIKKGEDHFLFEFGDSKSHSRLRWGGTKNILLDTLSDIKPSFSDDSLLRSLLSSDDDLLLFARPGGLTELKVSLDTLVDEGSKVKLNEVSLQIDYDYLDN